MAASTALYLLYLESRYFCILNDECLQRYLSHYPPCRPEAVTRCHGRDLQPRDGGAEAPGRHGEVARQQVHTVVSIHCRMGETATGCRKATI